MKTFITSIAVPSILASLAAGCVDDPALPDQGYLPQFASDPYGPAPSFRPSSCDEIATYFGGVTDGEYTLYIHNEPTYRWKAYCADMAGTPTEYLTLPNAGNGLNQSMFAS